MEFIISKEDNKMRRYDPQNRTNMIEFRKTKQIPFLEKHGFSGALGMEWFCFGYDYCMTGEKDKANEAFLKVKDVLLPCDKYFALVDPTVELLKLYSEHFSKKQENSYCIESNVNEFAM